MRIYHMKNIVLFLLFTCSAPSFTNLYAQQVSLKIILQDNEQQPLSNATVAINSKKLKADSNGIVLQMLNAGKIIIAASAINCYNYNQSFTISTDTLLQIVLKQRQSLLNTVVVRSSRNVLTNQMGVQTISAEVLKKLPVIFGEVDPLKTITLLPGIKNGGEGGGGVYVRGGGPDQNLVLLDGVNVYNPNHLLGFFSVFNGDAIKNIEVLKSGFPAEYGGRLSSVININSRDGDMQKIKTNAGIGLISSKLGVEGPIIKNKSSFIINARRTYIDQVAKPFAKERIGGNGYFFYDINARATFKLNDKNRLNLNFFNGVDEFTFSNSDGAGRTFNTNWGNTIAALHWEQKINSKLSHNTGIVYNRFKLDSRFSFSSIQFLFTSGLKDWQLKSDWTLKQYDWLKLKWGVQYINHTFKPGAGGVTAGVTNFETILQNKYAHELAGYVSADVDVLPELNLITGVRYSYFNQVGPTEEDIYDRDGFPTGEKVKYTKGQSLAQYQNPEPRISLRWKLNETTSIKLSYANTIQYLQLATTSNASFPSDLWLPASKKIKPGRANQISAGYFKNIKNNTYEFSAEVYYKSLGNQLEFKPGANLLLNANLENEMIFGTGKAYGLELFLNKKLGKLTGWVGYTLSRSERKFDAINAGKAFPYRYDRTHDLSIVANYPLSKKWEASAVFVYGTGNALTLPVGRFTYNLSYNTTENQPIFTNINLYDKINDYRMPAYHRLDISFAYTRKPNTTRRYKSSWNFGIYNVYNRYNPFFIYLSADEGTQKVVGKKVYLFPIVPSVTWNVKF
jgi:TonB dependent receptor/TonB-dependent Receptor Plug Domain